MADAVSSRAVIVTTGSFPSKWLLDGLDIFAVRPHEEPRFESVL